MDDKLKELFLSNILLKNQISLLDEKFIEKKLDKFFLTNCDLKKKIENEFIIKKEKIVKSKLFKEITKSIRKEVGQIYGQFLSSNFPKNSKILSNIKNLEESLELLKNHKSSKERYDYYDEIYTKIFSWKKEEKIADLACGLNPISIIYMKKHIKNPQIFASDLNKKDMDFLNDFFIKFNLNSIAKAFDLTMMDFLEDSDFKKKKLLFLFKALDSIEEEKKNLSKEILKKLPQKYIVVSFPTKSLKAKKNFQNNRFAWFSNFLIKMNWKFETFEIENEIFFLIEKSF